jgi:hypothetical protein
MVGAVWFFRRDLRRLAACISVLITGLSLASCGSTCGSNCPVTAFVVVATSGENLNVLTAQWTGPACPVGVTPLCRPDVSGANPCSVFTIIASQTGSCQLDLVFTDGRAPFSVVAMFGEETHQGCCRGFPVLDPAMVTVPPLHPVMLPDAGTDAADSAVTIAPDGSPADIATAD